MKVAVLYVGNKQETPEKILGNQQGNQEFEEFLLDLGWEVEISKHSGYRGGLDVKSLGKTKAHYYCNSTTEILYHVATKMVESDDPSQLEFLKVLSFLFLFFFFFFLSKIK